jgi:cytochrome P450 family 4
MQLSCSLAKYFGGKTTRESRNKKMLIFYCAIVLLIVPSLLWIFRTQIRKYQLSRKLPGPDGLLFIGNGLELINKTPPQFIKILQRYFDDHGKLVRLWLGPQLVVLMTDPKDVEVVLTSKNLITKSDEYNYLLPWLNTGLLTSTGNKWLSRRKVLTPAFHFKILDEFVDIFDKQSAIFVEKLKQFENHDHVNVFPLVALCALDVICETAMGISLNSQSGIESKYVNQVNE